jgi:hypothetical protein
VEATKKTGGIRAVCVGEMRSADDLTVYHRVKVRIQPV